MTESLEISLLGQIEIKRDGRPVTGFVSSKAPALLIYLAVTGHPHERETLAGLLWGDKSEQRARANLRKVLSNLRQTIGPSLVTEGQRVALPADTYRLDVRLVETSLAGDDPTDLDSLPQLRNAVELYRGDFLAGFAVEQAQAFEEWVLAERERLRRLALVGLHRLAAAYTARGEYAAAIYYTSRLLALEPWHEEAHRRLMLLLARSGQHAAALAQFESCRRILAEELGVEPLPETWQLYQRLTATNEPPPHNLPPPMTPFVGRERELAHLAHRLEQPTCRLLTLVGLGGIGKTRLALQAASDNLAAFKDGAFWVSLAEIGAAQQVAPAIAKALDCPLSGPTEPAQQLANYLAGRETLLLLDNLEHLLTPPEIDRVDALLLLLLTSAPDLKLLVTSRQPLNLHEEWVLEVEGLTLPAAEPVPLANPSAHLDSSAITLFVQHAQRVQANFSVTAANQVEVSRLCRLLDGMPLALELAAAWTPLLTCAEITAEIERDLSFLSAATRNRPDRQRSLRAVFESSWDLLPSAEQAVLQKLTVFSGSFQREAAIAVTGASLHELLALTGKSLLRRDAGGRYEMHELLRQYAAEKLARDPVALAETRHRHSRIYLEFLATHETPLQQDSQPQSLREIGEAWENIQTAWQRALAQADFEAIHRAGKSLFLFCDTTSRFQTGEMLLQTALDRLGSEDGQATLMAALLAYQGRLLYNQGHYQTAHSCLERSLTLARRQAALPLMAFALHSLGLVAVMQGQYDQAKQVSRESLTLCRQVGDRWGEAWALYALGWAAYYLGEYHPAQRLSQAGLRRHRRLGNRHGEAACLNTLGLVVCGRYEYRLAQHPEATAYFEQNLALRQAIGDRWGEATALHNLGYVQFKLGQYDLAQSRFEASLALAHLIGALNMQAATGMWLGVTAMEQADYAGAEHHLREALRLANQHGALGRVTDTLYRLGDLWARQGQLAPALECLSVVRDHPATDERVREGARRLLAKLADQQPPSETNRRSQSLDELVALVLAG